MNCIFTGQLLLFVSCPKCSVMLRDSILYYFRKISSGTISSKSQICNVLMGKVKYRAFKKKRKLSYDKKTCAVSSRQKLFEAYFGRNEVGCAG